MERKNVNTTLSVDLYQTIRRIAFDKGFNANDLLEEGMLYIIKKYGYEKYLTKKEGGVNDEK